MIPEEVAAFRGKYRAQRIPWWYRGWAHALFTWVVLAALVAFPFSQLRSVRLVEWSALPLILVGGNFFVYIFHRWVLHRKLPGGLGLGYQIHTLQHHYFYTDEAVTPESQQDWHILLFPPQVVLAFAFLVEPLLLVGVGVLVGPNAGWLTVLGASVYFFLYECAHSLSHVPERSSLLKFWPFRILWEHHRLHHRKGLMGKWNFDIVFPSFDLLFGTSWKSAHK